LALNFVNGCLDPVLEVYNASNERVYVFECPSTNGSGMTEEHEDLSVERDDLNNISKLYFLGYKRHFNLDYSKLLRGGAFLEFKKIIDYAHNVIPGGPYKVYLTPRSDNPADRVLVLFKKNNIIISILKGRRRAPGMKDVIIKMKSVNVFYPLQISDPNNLQIFMNDFYLN